MTTNIFSRNRFILISLFALFGMEIYCAIYKGNPSGYIINTFIFPASGLLIAILPFFLTAKKCSPEMEAEKQKIFIRKILIFLSFTAIFIIATFSSIRTLHIIPIDYHFADMIPQVRICCERLLHGERVYKPMPEIWSGMLPTYFPMMWLPYLPAEFLGVDVRWTGVIFLLAGISVSSFNFPLKRKNVFGYLLALIAIIFSLVLNLFSTDRSFIALSEEPVVIGYYLFLGFAMIKKNPWLTGIAIGCCLLSRFMLLFWVPVFIVFLFFFESRKAAIRVSTTVFIFVLFIFVIPFGLAQPGYFLALPNIYRKQAQHFFTWNSDTIPDNLGFAKFFSETQVPLLHLLDIFFAAFIPVVCLLLYFQFRKKLESNRQFLGLCSLKLTMVFFYCFVEIPFSYLFFVPVFFTLPIVILAIREGAGL